MRIDPSAPHSYEVEAERKRKEEMQARSFDDVDIELANSGMPYIRNGKSKVFPEKLLRFCLFSAVH
jgi:hypothetical protein